MVKLLRGHSGPASGYLDLESFGEMVVLEAGHIDDARERRLPQVHDFLGFGASLDFNTVLLAFNKPHGTQPHWQEWFQHLQHLADGSPCISSQPELFLFAFPSGSAMHVWPRYALLQQTAIRCPKLPGAADSAAPWEPIALQLDMSSTPQTFFCAFRRTSAQELLPRLLSVWRDLAEAFGWESQDSFGNAAQPPAFD